MYRLKPAYLLLIVIVLVFSACQEDSFEISSNPEITPFVQEPFSPSPTPKSTQTKRPRATETLIPFPATRTPFPATPTPENTLLCSPLAPYSIPELSEIVSDPYHPPPPGRDERHQGVDFSHYRRGELLTIEGVDVQAVLAGKVAYSEENSWPYGNVIMIETNSERLPEFLLNKLAIKPGESLYLLYAHLLMPPNLKIGDLVEACQVIGEVGATGNTVQPHLHLEARFGIAGAEFLSMRFYKTDATPEQQAAYKLWRTSGYFRHFDPMILFEP